MQEVQPHPSILSVETPEAVAFSYELAGIGSRGAAIVIDTVLLVLLVAVEGGVAALAGLLVDAAGLADAAMPWIIGTFILVAFATYWGYFVFGEVVRGGRTPGKRYMGIRVVRDDGGPVRFTDSVVRNVLRMVDMLPGYYAVGIVAALLSRHGKRLGDMAAGTVVVRDAGELAIPEVATLRSPQAQVVKEYLDRRSALTPAARHQVAVELLALFGETPQPGWDEPVIAGRLADVAGLRGEIDAGQPSG